jgi:glycosyltransferase involved in cell wall biosynthesis
VVVEAAARGTPSVVVAGAENAAVELVADHVNGIVAPSPTPETLAEAIVQVVRAGPELRASTTAWFVENAASLQLGRSLEVVTRAYEADTSGRLADYDTG